jgi:hypothetical protein
MKNIKNFNLLGELSDNEIENFFAEGNEKTISAWKEGDGRGQSNYEILRFDSDKCFVCGTQGNSVYVLRSEHYGFDDFNQPTYHFITMKNNSHEDLNQVINALYETIGWVGQVVDERSDHPIFMMLQDAIDTLEHVSL